MLVFAIPFALQEITPEERPVLIDQDYATACGPISCYAALISMGNTSERLDDIARRCNWKKEPVGFDQMYQVLSETRGITAFATRISPEELVDYLAKGQGVAVIPVRKDSEEINHAVCAMSVADNHIILFDYPELRRQMTLAELGNVWDGHAILVARKYDWNLVWLTGLSVIPGIVIAIAVRAALSNWIRKTQETP